MTNIATATFTDGVNSSTAQDSATVTIRNLQAIPSVNITDAAGGGVAYQPSRTITWNVQYTNDSFEDASISPDVYIAVPRGLEYLTGSIVYKDIGALGYRLPQTVSSYPAKGNLEGMTIVHISWPVDVLMQKGRKITFSLQTMVNPAQPPGTFSGNPAQYGRPASQEPTMIIVGGSVNNQVDLFGNSDQYDLNKNGSDTDVMAMDQASWTVNNATVAYGDVRVMGNLDAVYSTAGLTTPGGAATYKIKLINASNDGSTLKDFVFYQTLPRVGDSYVSEGSEGTGRGSQFAVTLTGPITAPAGVAVQYSLATNPCRDEVYPDVNNTGCDPMWTNSVSDWSQVTAIKYAMGGTYGPGQGEAVELPVVVPSDAAVDQVAYTSIAYRATNAVTGTTLLPAEAPKVALTIKDAALSIQKSSSIPFDQAVLPGELLTYTVALKNQNAVDVVNTKIDDDLADVLAIADVATGSLSVKSSQSGRAPSLPVFSNSHISWSGTVHAGGTVTLVYSVKIKDNAPDNQTFKNTVIGSGSLSGGGSVSSSCVYGYESGCGVFNKTQASGITVYKYDNYYDGSPVLAGNTIDYTINVNNVGDSSVVANVVDDLTSVLQSSDIVPGSLQAVDRDTQEQLKAPIVAGNTLTWNDTIAPRTTVSIGYQVKVKEGASGNTMTNHVIATALADGRPVPTTCETGNEHECSTMNAVRSPDDPAEKLTVSKTANVASGSIVKPGDEITYKVRLKNDGIVFLEGHMVDSLLEVEKHATYVDNSLTITSSAPTPSLDADAKTITWDGMIQPGEEIVITYKYKVNPDAYGVQFTNSMKSTGTVHIFQPDQPISTKSVPTSCTTGSEQNCFVTLSTEKPSVKLTAGISQSIDEATKLKAGDKISYTVTAANKSEYLLRDVHIVNDVSALLQNGTIDPNSFKITSSDGSSLPNFSIVGNNIVWKGDVPAGVTVTLHYDFVIKDNPQAGTLVNRIVSYGTSDIVGTVASNCTGGSQTGCSVSGTIGSHALGNGDVPALAATGVNLYILGIMAMGVVVVGIRMLMR